MYEQAACIRENEYDNTSSVTALPCHLLLKEKAYYDKEK